MSSTLERLVAAAQKRGTRKITLPELEGQEVWVRSLSGAEGLALAAKLKENADGPNKNAAAALNAALFLHAYLCEEDGTPVAPTVEEARRLIEVLPMSAMNRIVAAGQRLNSADTEAPETLEKN